MGPRSKKDNLEKLGSLRILGEIDRKTNYVFAHMAPKNGPDSHENKTVVRERRFAGYAKMILKSNQEPSILALL